MGGDQDKAGTFGLGSGWGISSASHSSNRSNCLRIPTHPDSRSGDIRTRIPDYPDILTAAAERSFLMSFLSGLVKRGAARPRHQ